MSGDLSNMFLKDVERWIAARYTERHGLVTSYDPKKYLAKVTFQPEGQESGWLPIETGHIGEGYGIAIGLTAGDGTSTGDQIVARYQEGDIESGKIVQRVHSNNDTPPETQSGEMNFWTSGKKIVFSDNKGKKGTYQLDGKGNFTSNTITNTATSTDKMVTQIASEDDKDNITEVKHSSTLDKDNGITHSAFDGQHTVALGSDGVTTNSSGKITDIAEVISHNGNTTVSKTLSVAKTAVASAFGVTSDARLKDHIEDYQPTFEEFMKFSLHKFNIREVHWETGQAISPSRPSFGSIAQEIREIWPLLVTEQNGYLTVDEGKFSMIVASILQQYIVRTDERIADLETCCNHYEDRITSLEKRLDHMWVSE